MAWTDAHRSSEQRANREAILTAMREKWRRKSPRVVMRKIRKQRPAAQGAVRVKARPLTPATLARAIRIAAELASKKPNPNPLFVEALEVAATYFDDL